MKVFDHVWLSEQKDCAFLLLTAFTRILRSVCGIYVQSCSRAFMRLGVDVGPEGLACNLHFSSSQRWLTGVEIRILCSSVKFFHTKFIKLHLYSPCFMHWGRVIMWKDKEAILNHCHKVGNITVLCLKCLSILKQKVAVFFFSLCLHFTHCVQTLCVWAPHLVSCFGVFLWKCYSPTYRPSIVPTAFLGRFLSFGVDEAISRNNVTFTTQSFICFRNN